MAPWRRCQTKPGTGCMMSWWKWIMQCLVTSNFLWQAVPSKPRPEHTYPSSHRYTSVWWPTFWVLWNTAHKEIAMSSRRYPDVMLCGSMNSPPLLCNPEWPLFQDTKKTTEIRNAVRCMGNALTAHSSRFHTKTTGNLNAAGRIQDGLAIVLGHRLDCVWCLLPRTNPIGATTDITMWRKIKRWAFGWIGLRQFPFGWTMLCWCNKLKYTKKALSRTLNLIARLSKPLLPEWTTLKQSLREKAGKQVQYCIVHVLDQKNVWKFWKLWDVQIFSNFRTQDCGSFMSTWCPKQPYFNGCLVKQPFFM